MAKSRLLMERFTFIYTALSFDYTEMAATDFSPYRTLVRLSSFTPLASAKKTPKSPWKSLNIVMAVFGVTPE